MSAQLQGQQPCDSSVTAHCGDTALSYCTGALPALMETLKASLSTLGRWESTEPGRHRQGASELGGSTEQTKLPQVPPAVTGLAPGGPFQPKASPILQSLWSPCWFWEHRSQRVPAQCTQILLAPSPPSAAPALPKSRLQSPEPLTAPHTPSTAQPHKNPPGTQTRLPVLLSLWVWVFLLGFHERDVPPQGKIKQDRKSPPCHPVALPGVTANIQHFTGYSASFFFFFIFNKAAAHSILLLERSGSKIQESLECNVSLECRV